MLRSVLSRLAFGASALVLAAPAYAQLSQATFDVPAGDMRQAVDAWSAQSGRQVLYRVDDLKGQMSPGVKGAVPADQALAQILGGGGLAVRQDPSGAVAIVKQDAFGPAAVPQQGAEADDVMGDKIVVTARRVEENGQEVPIAITAISQEGLRQ